MYSKEFEKLLKFRPRKEEEELKEVYCDLAASVQEITTEMMLNTIDNIRSKYKVDNIACSVEFRLIVLRMVR